MRLGLVGAPRQIPSLTIWSKQYTLGRSDLLHYLCAFSPCFLPQLGLFLGFPPKNECIYFHLKFCTSSVCVQITTDNCFLWLKMFSSNIEPQKGIGNIWHLGFAGWEEGDAGGRHVGEESRLSTGREDATSSMPVARVLPAAQQDIPSINSQRLPVFAFKFRFVFVLSGRQDILSVNSAWGAPLAFSVSSDIL